jgi:hypothetical protein
MTDSTLIDLPFTFDVPAEFQAFDLRLTPAQRADAIIERMQSLAPPPSDEEITKAVLTQQTTADLLDTSGVVYAGTLLARSEANPGLPMSVFLSVSVRPSELTDKLTIDRLTSAMAVAMPEAEVGVVVLPSGPAVLVTEEVSLGTAVNLVESSGGSIVRQLHVLVPIPGRTAVADFSIATESIADWEQVVGILASICGTITFT